MISMNRVIFVVGVLVAVSGASAVPSNTVYPAYAEGYAQPLNGDWAFKYIPSLDAGDDGDFYKPGSKTSDWKTIPVPANWEMEGFAEPKYGLRLEDGLGLYLRNFPVPAEWKDERRVCIRFEGVAYGFKIWVNGREIGESWASAYNPHTFDITDAVLPGDANLLAVQVSTKPRGYKFDLNDDWSLSGIFRDVTLFSVPSIHVQEIATVTKLSKDGSAELTVDVTVNDHAAEVRGQLFSPDGERVDSFTLSRTGKDGRCEAVLKVSAPQLWTAETPALYRLRLDTASNDQSLQTIERRIGLREIFIKDGVLLLNGRPIKLHGVTHHDLDPVTGRAQSEERIRQDLELMKKGNINFIRTSHYPPNERLIELCDEMGLYVMDEVPLASRGGECLEDPDYKENIFNRVDATITRDRNHPSVMVWSVGNENHMNEGEIMAIRRLKEIDQTRPVTLPKTAGEFGSNRYEYPECVDIFAAHYPSTGYMEAWATRVDRPMIFTEYAHAQGLATERIESQWAIMQETPQYAGGSVWHFHDQGILRASDKPVDPNEYTVYAWPDKNHYYDTGEKLSSNTKGLDGADGIVYADRTPQTDFREVRKVYSPVQIAESFAEVNAGRQEVSATVENRYDFRSLAGMKLDWSLQQNGKAIQTGEVALSAPSHEKETVQIPVTVPAEAIGDVLALELNCIDESGRQITERSIRLDVAGSPREAWLDQLPASGRPRVTENDEEVHVRIAGFDISIERATSELSIRDQEGQMLVAGIYPHPGRKRLMVEGRGSGSRFGYWPASLLKSADQPSVRVSKKGTFVSISVSGRYPRTDDSDQMLNGGYEITVTPAGVLNIHYRYEPVDAKGNFAEAGLSVVMPSEFSEFRWIGDGPYPGYPGKERLNEFGLFHLNREDLYFQGNRRRTELAMLTTPAGAGIALITSPSDVAVERDEQQGQILLSHNAIISSLGNKIGGPETSVKASDVKEMEGDFTLLLLEENWPESLIRRFGKPAAATNVFQPFFHSYDQ